MAQSDSKESGLYPNWTQYRGSHVVAEKPGPEQNQEEKKKKWHT
jgi:hypothetical protein